MGSQFRQVYVLKSLLWVSQFLPDVFWFQVFYPLDEVALFQTAFAALVPVVEDLFQVSYFELLEVYTLEIDLLFWKFKSIYQYEVRYNYAIGDKNLP